MAADDVKVRGNTPNAISGQWVEYNAFQPSPPTPLPQSEWRKIQSFCSDLALTPTLPLLLLQDDSFAMVSEKWELRGRVTDPPLREDIRVILKCRLLNPIVTREGS